LRTLHIFNQLSKQHAHTHYSSDTHTHTHVVPLPHTHTIANVCCSLCR